MSTNKKMIAVAMAAVAAGCLWLAVSAQAEPADAGARHKGGPRFGLAKMFAELNITAGQQQKIAAILLAHREEMRTAMDGLVEAGTAMAEAVQAAEYDEQAVRAASRALAAKIEDAAVLRAKLGCEVRNVLTADQQAQLATLREKIGGKVKEGIARGRDLLDLWIDTNAAK